MSHFQYVNKELLQNQGRNAGRGHGLTNSETKRTKNPKSRNFERDDIFIFCSFLFIV